MATNNATNTSSPITVSQGGTGLSTLTAHSVQLGNGTSSPTQLSVGASGTLLNGSTGADPSWSSSPLISVSGGPQLKIYGTGATTNFGGTILLANDCTTANYGGTYIACNIQGSDTSKASLFVQQRTNANGFVAGIATFDYSTQSWIFATSGASNLIINSTGQQTNGKQCCFLYYLGANVTNAIGTVTTTYTMGTNALTVVYNIGSAMTTGGVFTAPVTGKYRFTFQIAVTNCTILKTLVADIETTARTYRCEVGRTATNNDMGLVTNCLADMTAADTATFKISGIGEAADTDTIVGTTLPYTFICGELVT